MFSAIVNTCKCLKSIKWKFWFNSTIVGRIRLLTPDFAPLLHHKAMIENVIQNFRCGSRHDPFGHISVVDMISFATFFQQHLRNYNFCDGISAFVFLLGNFAVQFISSRNSQPQVGKKNQVISLVSHFVIRIVIKLNLSHFIPRYSMHF